MSLQNLITAVEDGNTNETKKLVTEALEQKVSLQEIMDALISAMANIGEMFKNDEIFVPEMILSARAMTGGLQILEPLMIDADMKPIGTVVIGTIKGDLHEIGKNLVAMMMKGIGATVYDLGIDVSPEQFLEKAKEVDADIIAISSLLTTTMAAMPDVIETFENAGIRDKVFFMVGGAPISQRYADEIGADGYTKDAGTAADLAQEYLRSKAN